MADSEVFRIMSLAGGGARGLLQAEYLALADRDFGGGILKHVDLLAGTSTGAITAGCLAAGITPARIRQLFSEEVIKIFPPRSGAQKLLSYFQDRPRYDVRPLEDALSKLLHTTRLRDLKMPLIITASSVSDHQVRIFTSLDGDETLLLDAILASAAAPTYFPPRLLGGVGPGYYDGGLWANDPSLVALLHARTEMGVDKPVRLLEIGTGRTPVGANANKLAQTPTLSKDMATAFLEMTSSLQASFISYSINKHIVETAILHINPEIPAGLTLDNAKECLARLPGIAHTEHRRTRQQIHSLLSSPPAAEELESRLISASGIELIKSNSRYTQLILDFEKKAEALDYVQWRIPVFFKSALVVEEIADGRWPTPRTEEDETARSNYIDEHQRRCRQFRELLKRKLPVRELIDRQRLEEYVKEAEHAGLASGLPNSRIVEMLEEWAKTLEENDCYQVAVTTSTLPAKYRIVRPHVVITHEPVKDPNQVSGVVYYGRSVYKTWMFDFDRKWAEVPESWRDKGAVVQWMRGELTNLASGAERSQT